MLNRMGSKAGGANSLGEDGLAPATFEARIPADFTRLSGDEIERLITLCKPRAVLWRHETASAREPEPFGMIA
jgi:hypothetical protein